MIPTIPEPAHQQEVRLLGHSSLGGYIDFVRHRVVGGATIEKREIIADWRRANAVYQSLEDSELCIADEIEILDLPDALIPLADELRCAPWFRRSFTKLPTRFAMVELDRLVMFQNWVTRTFVDSVRERFGDSPTAEDIFRFCLPVLHPGSPVRMQRLSSDRYVFTCESMDFRVHGARLLDMANIVDEDPSGPAAAGVGIIVGFGSNFLNAIEVGGRLLLHNGYHRCYAMRAHGITHAPCIIQTIEHPAEISIAAKRSVTEDTDFYFKSARPPLLKDFFDPRLHKVHTVYRCVRRIEVRVEATESVVSE